MKYQARYLAYCKVHAMPPEKTLAHDRKKFPGGLMCGFINWIAEKKAEFKKCSPESFYGDFISDQDKFTKFLEGQKCQQE